MKKMTYLLAAVTVLFVATGLSLDQYGQRTPALDEYDAIIVLGCRVRPDGTPSLALQARTRKAVELYHQGYAQKIVLTGGVGTHAPAESVAAFEYATKNLGVPPNVFVLEQKSTSTEENARFASEVFGAESSVLIVSDAYHVFRAERVFDKYFEHVDGSGRIPIPEYRLKGTSREVLALIFYWAQGRL